MASSTVYLSLQRLEDQDLVEVSKHLSLRFKFFDDTISYLKGQRIPFLTKYGTNLGVGNVVPLRDFLIQVVQVGLRRSPPTSTLDFVKEGIAGYVSEQEVVGVDAKMIEILSICVFSRREELRKVFTELVFQSAVDRHLVDYNYNIEVKISIIHDL
jgi:hypothetical protein